MGEKKAKSLLKHFGSLKKIRAASPNELCEVSGISERLAKNISAYFGSSENTD